MRAGNEGGGGINFAIMHERGGGGVLQAALMVPPSGTPGALAASLPANRPASVRVRTAEHNPAEGLI